MVVAAVGETLSLTREFNGARAEQASCIVPTLGPPHRQCSKEGCSALVNTEGPTPLQLNRCAKTGSQSSST